MYGEPAPCWINKSKLHWQLLQLYEQTNFPTYTYELFPVHIIFEETNGSLNEVAIQAVNELELFRKYHQGLEDWIGKGWSGESFALRGVVNRSTLKYISNIPGVKTIFQILEVDMDILNTHYW